MTQATEAVRARLLRGWKLERRVKAREEQLDVLRDRMQRVRSAAPRGLAGDRRGPKADWTDAVDALADAEAEYLKEISAMCAVKGEVKREVGAVRTDLYRELLEYRYVYCLGWEEVADRLGYDLRYVYKLHDKALKEVAHGEG